MVDLKQDKTVQVTLVGGRVLREITTFDLVTQMDAIISVPILKTHDQGQITLALKNLKGLVIDGDKRRIHQIGMFEGAVDLVSHFKPIFAVVDAIIGQEGMGPLLGLPVEMGLVLAGRDLVAVDAIAGRIMGFAPDEVPITAAAAARGLGTMDEAEIRVVGEPVASVARRFVRCGGGSSDRRGRDQHRPQRGHVHRLPERAAQLALRYAGGRIAPTRARDDRRRRADAAPRGIPQEYLVGIGSCAPARGQRPAELREGLPSEQRGHHSRAGRRADWTGLTTAGGPGTSDPVRERVAVPGTPVCLRARHRASRHRAAAPGGRRCLSAGGGVFHLDSPVRRA